MNQIPGFWVAHMSLRLGRAKKMSADLTGRAWPWTQPPETVHENQMPGGPTVVITGWVGQPEAHFAEIYLLFISGDDEYALSSGQVSPVCQYILVPSWT